MTPRLLYLWAERHSEQLLDVVTVLFIVGSLVLAAHFD